MNLNNSLSFSDVTNSIPTQRRKPPHYAVQNPAPPVVTVSMFEELSAKLDNLTQKVDAIFELLMTNETKPSVPFPGEQTDEFNGMESVSPHKHEEMCNVVSLLDSALHQKNTAQQSLQPLQEMEEAPLLFTDETNPTEYRKGPSSAGRGENPAWMKRDCCILLVEFKCQRVKRCEAEVFITPGQYAIVQGDRGHDCGVVNQCSEWSAELGKFVREEGFDGTIVNVARMKNEMGRVVRVATELEVERLFGEIARNENLALKTCREIVNRLGLEMEVVDCEYQFDQQKISFYYEASRSIDFRQLNNELYRIFGVRIWLQNVNNAVKNVVPAGAMSRTDKAQYHKSGLRPPSFK